MRDPMWKPSAHDQDIDTIFFCTTLKQHYWDTSVRRIYDTIKKIARSCSEQYVLTPLSMHCTVLCCAQVQLIVTISEPRWAGDIGHLRRHFLLHKQSNGKISSRLKSLTFYGPIVSSPSSFCRISKQLQRRDGTRLDQDSHPNEKSAQPSHFVRRLSQLVYRCKLSFCSGKSKH